MNVWLNKRGKGGERHVHSGTDLRHAANDAGADIQVVFDVTKALYEKQKSAIAPMTREEMLRDLEASRQQAGHGEGKPALQALEKVMAEYGL